MSASYLEIARPLSDYASGNNGWSGASGTETYQSGTIGPAAAFEIITDRAGFDALEADWNALFERAGQSHQMFLTFNWLWHWCNHYFDPKGPATLSVLTARTQGRLVMVWPLIKERTHGITELSWMGDPMSQYGDVLAEPGTDGGALLAQAWSYLKEHTGADLVRLRKVRADARIAPLLATLDGLITERLEAPYLDLASAKNFAEYETRYSSGSRRNRKRLYRRLDELGKITFEEVGGGERARELIRTAVVLKRQWLKSRGLVSKAYADDRIIGFFADAVCDQSKPTNCRIAVLSTAGRPAAIEVALQCKDRIGLHIIVFDLEFEKSGAGVLLLEQSYRNAADSGVACYDLLAPGDKYKSDWADASVAVNDWALPLSIKGHIYARAYLGFLRERLKACHAALPQSVRQKLSERVSRLAAAA